MIVAIGSHLIWLATSLADVEGAGVARRLSILLFIPETTTNNY